MKSACLLFALAACATESDGIDPATCGAPAVYRIDRVSLPISNAAASGTGFDLDDNGTPDNQLGHLVGNLNDLFDDLPLDLTARANQHLDTDTAWRISIADCGEQRLVAIGELDAELSIEGSIADGTLTAKGDGTTRVPLVAMFDGTGTVDSMFAPTEHTQLALTQTGNELDGTLGFAIESGLARWLVVHALTPFLDEFLDVYRSGFDTDGDGVITETEVATSAVGMAQLYGDVEIGRVHALSLAVDVHATKQ